MAWVGGNRYLSRTEMEGNARMIKSYLTAVGWSITAICGLLGNMQSESGLNPGIWESLTVNTSRGYGLVQWTPATKYIEWAGDEWENNGNLECARINYEADNNIQWFYNPEADIQYPVISFSDFKVSNLPAATLAKYFLWWYEHPANIHQDIRAEQADEWLEFFGEDPGPDPTPVHPKRKMPLWMYMSFI